MHYYQFNIGDYRKDTGHLSTLEHGIYRQLLDWYFLEEKPIPKETQTVLRRLRLDSESDMKALQNVLADFFVLQDDGYHQGRCDLAIREYHERADKNKANGKRGGRPKKTQSVILGNPDETKIKGNHEPNNPITHKSNSSSLRSEDAPTTKRQRGMTVAKPVDVTDVTWLSFLANCKAKSKPPTDLVMLKIRREAVAAGLSLEQALVYACEKSWARFEHDWWLNEQRKSRHGTQTQAESFYEREDRLKREEAAKWGGAPSTTDFLTIDAEVNHVPAIEGH